MSAPTKMAYLSAQVPADVLESFKKLAKDGERSMSAELRIAMRAHLDAQVAEPVPARDAA